MISKSSSIRIQLVAVLMVGGLTTASCGIGEQDTPPDLSETATSASPMPTDPAAPPRASGPTGEDQREELYEYCETSANDPLCHTGRFGNNLRAADKFLEGPEVGPGGLGRMTATDDGFPAGSIVGSSVTMVNATWNVDISEVISTDGSCEVLMDRNTHLGVVADLGGIVQAFLILNPVVETVDGIRVGSSLADLQAKYPVDVLEYGTGKIAYTVREEDVSSYHETVEPSRAMLFYLSADDAIEMWVVGATSYVAGTTSEGLCPVS